MWDRSWWFEICVVLCGLVSFVIVGPLHGVFEALPGVMLAATFILFAVPGLMVARWFLGEFFSGMASLPVAVTISVGIFALIGLPALILQSSLETYLWACGVLVAGCLLLAACVAALGVVRPSGRHTRTGAGRTAPGRGGIMWLPFAALTAVSVYVARSDTPGPYGDIWVYLSWIRQYLGGGTLASVEPYFGHDVGVSRARINGWLLEQASFSKVSGVGPVDLLFQYMNPALVVVALMGFYALARVLFESEKTALFCGSLYALFLLVHLDATTLSFGGEFFLRPIEDKIAAKFLFLPVALGAAVAFLKGGGKAYFWCFAFLCATSVLVHPIGLAIIGISMAGFSVFHLAANLKSRVSWLRVSVMGLAGVAIVAIPALCVFAFTGESLTTVLADADINSGDPAVLRNMIFVVDRGRIFELANGLYMMHPSLLLDPVIAAAFLLGFPFLLPKLGRSLAAQLLFGTMYLTTVLVYVPRIATFLGENVVLPGQIWRLAWPIPLAAMLTLGWLSWVAVTHAGAWATRRAPASRLAPRLIPALPVLLVVVLTVATFPRAADGMQSIRDHVDAMQSSGVYPPDPIFPWLHDELSSPVVVLAPDVESARIPAFSSEANVVSRRGGLVLNALPALEQRVSRPIRVPQGALDVQEFFRGTTLSRAVEILRRNEVDYVMVQAGSPLDKAIERLPGFDPVSEPSQRYDVYGVDLRTLERMVGGPGTG